VEALTRRPLRGLPRRWHFGSVGIEVARSGNHSCPMARLQLLALRLPTRSHGDMGIRHSDCPLGQTTYPNTRGSRRDGSLRPAPVSVGRSWRLKERWVGPGSSIEAVMAAKNPKERRKRRVPSPRRSGDCARQRGRDFEMFPSANQQPDHQRNMLPPACITVTVHPSEPSIRVHATARAREKGTGQRRPTASASARALAGTAS
jgi:hypothetical protein